MSTAQKRLVIILLAFIVFALFGCGSAANDASQTVIRGADNAKGILKTGTGGAVNHCVGNEFGGITCTIQNELGK